MNKVVKAKKYILIQRNFKQNYWSLLNKHCQDHIVLVNSTTLSLVECYMLHQTHIQFWIGNTLSPWLITIKVRRKQSPYYLTESKGNKWLIHISIKCIYGEVNVKKLEWNSNSAHLFLVTSNYPLHHPRIQSFIFKKVKERNKRGTQPFISLKIWNENTRTLMD